MKYINFKKYQTSYKKNFCGIVLYSSNDFYAGRKDTAVFAVQYIKNGKCHRENGPAIIISEGNFKKYYLFGKEVTKKEHDFLYDLLKLKNLI